jgi:hypothetical protein
VLLGWVLRDPAAPKPSFLTLLALLLIAANVVVLLPKLDRRWFIRGFVFAILPLAILLSEIAGTMAFEKFPPLLWALIAGVLVLAGNLVPGDRQYT